VALPTLPDPAALVTLGVDTHAETHIATALDHAGRLLGTHTIPTTPAGYAALLAWASTLGSVDRVGVEGTGSYGAGLARWLRAHGQVVVEVDRPDRAARRRQGKADDLDAHAAARAVQAGAATTTPKAADGQVEMIRSLRLARRSAVKARTQAANQLGALGVTAPDGLRAQLRSLPLAELVATAARLRPDPVPATPTDAAKFALRSVAGRWLQLTEEITELDTHLERLVATATPTPSPTRACCPPSSPNASDPAGGRRAGRPRRPPGRAPARPQGADPAPLDAGGWGRHRRRRPAALRRHQPGARPPGHGPSTVGTFLRLFTFGHVRQLDRLTEQLLTRAWRPAPDQAMGR
jgi:transposase